MNIELPDINDLFEQIIQITFSFDGNQKTIKGWLKEHRKAIKANQDLLNHHSEESDIKILLAMLRDILIRATKGERGIRVYEELVKNIKSKRDLTTNNYKKTLKNARYRWGIVTGTQVITDVVRLFANKYKWNWSEYFEYRICGNFRFRWLGNL